MTHARYVAMLVSAMVSCVLASTLLVLSIFNRQTERRVRMQQVEFNNLQNEINRGAASQRVVQNIIQELITMAPNKPNIQSLLARYGIVTNKKSSSSNP